MSPATVVVVETSIVPAIIVVSCYNGCSYAQPEGLYDIHLAQVGS